MLLLFFYNTCSNSLWSMSIVFHQDLLRRRREVWWSGRYSYKSPAAFQSGHKAVNEGTAKIHSKTVPWTKKRRTFPWMKRGPTVRIMDTQYTTTFISPTVYLFNLVVIRFFWSKELVNSCKCLDVWKYSSEPQWSLHSSDLKYHDLPMATPNHNVEKHRKVR